MAKRRTKATARKAPARRRNGPFGTGTIPAPPAVVEAATVQTPEETIAILHRQVTVAREAFFKLVQYRASDRVRFGDLDWNQATEYINNELSGLDQQLASVVPQ